MAKNFRFSLFSEICNQRRNRIIRDSEALSHLVLRAYGASSQLPFCYPYILFELESILRNKFGWEDEHIARVLNLIKTKATEVQSKHRLSVIKEKDADNRIMECAVEGKADCIISGDKRHILSLKEYSGIRILSPDEFLRLWGTQLL